MLRPGTLDDTRELDPCAHVWIRSKQAWISLPQGVATWQTQPDDPLQLLELWNATARPR
jgi:hypothetical protein